MRDRIRVAIAVACGGALLWFVTFVVEWSIRTEWKQHWLDGAIRAWANFSMLGWFDTTFATGVLAVVAASAVLISGHLDRQARWREMQVVRLAEILNRIGQTQLILRRAAHELATRERAEHFEGLLAEAEAMCQALASDVRPIAHIVMFTVSRVKEIAFQAGPNIDARQGPREKLRTLLWGAILSIEDADRLFESGTGRFVPSRYLLNSAERDVFKASVLSEYDRRRFAEWLDWST